jgi:RNA polymerase sigma factor (sigma-70 family)
MMYEPAGSPLLQQRAPMVGGDRPIAVAPRRPPDGGRDAAARAPSGAAPDGDGELVTRWRAGDQAAGEALFARHFDALYRFFASKSADPGDLTQATLLAVVRSRQQFAGRSSFRTYLFCIARNELYDHLRAQRRGRAFDPAVSSIVDLVTTPATQLDRGEDHRRLCQALRQLPVEQQTLLELHYWEELDAAALAEVFEAPPATIRTRLRRARIALRASLQEGADDSAAAVWRGEPR